MNVIKDMLRNSNNFSARITSTARTPKDQARAMYNNLIGSPQNIITQRNLYRPPGQQVIDVFEKEQQAGKTKVEILNAMEAKIWELGPGKVSRHCADFTKLVVLDIAPSSIKHKSEFVTEVKSDERVSKFLGPSSGDRAYHIEIPNKSSNDTTHV